MDFYEELKEREKKILFKGILHLKKILNENPNIHYKDNLHTALRHALDTETLQDNSNLNKNLFEIQKLFWNNQDTTSWSDYEDICNEILELLDKERTPEKNQEPTPTYMRELYKVYKVIRNSNIGNNRIKLLTYLFAWKPWTMRVVGISLQAVKDIYSKSSNHAKGLQRDHFIQDRKLTYSEMVDNELSYDQWFKLYWENDKTIIMTKEEHNKKNNGRKNVKIYPLDWEEGYFACNDLIGFKCRKTIEVYYLRRNISEEDLKSGNKFITQQEVADIKVEYEKGYYVSIDHFPKK